MIINTILGEIAEAANSFTMVGRVSFLCLYRLIPDLCGFICSDIHHFPELDPTQHTLSEGYRITRGGFGYTCIVVGEPQNFDDHTLQNLIDLLYAGAYAQAHKEVVNWSEDYAGTAILLMSDAGHCFCLEHKGVVFFDEGVWGRGRTDLFTGFVLSTQQVRSMCVSALPPGVEVFIAHFSFRVAETEIEIPTVISGKGAIRSLMSKLMCPTSRPAHWWELYDIDEDQE